MRDPPDTGKIWRARLEPEDTSEASPQGGAKCYVGWKDRKAFASDLRAIYTAVNEEEALRELDSLREKWEARYPNAIKSQERNWGELCTYFLYPEPLRRLIYTTNAIESVHYQLHKVTNSKGSFPSDDSMLKMLHLATMQVCKKWTMRIRDWDLMLGQLEILDEQLKPGNSVPTSL